MKHFLVLLLAGAFSGPLFLASAQKAGATEANPRYEAACRHYANRARFKAREGTVEFVTVLADACRASVISLRADRAEERATARVFLDRLVLFHDTIIDMNMERVFGANASPFARPLSGEGAMVGIPQVSAVGEFLIAHHMGLVDALDAWIGSGVEFSLASRIE